MPGVYMILNTRNSKVYVGGTARSLKGRWDEHKSCLRNNYHHNSHLQASWSKYGEGAFSFWVLQETTIEDVWDAEQAWLDFFLGVGKVYNFGPVATNPLLGCIRSDETRRKMSVARKGKKGRKQSDETRRKLSAINKGKKLTEEHKRKLSVAAKGKRFAEETKQKMSAAHKGKIFSDEHRRKMSINSMGRRLSEGAKRKLREAHSKQYPALYNTKTRETIPSGVNGKKLCVERGWHTCNFSQLVNGKQRSMKGWVVAGMPTDFVYWR